MTDVQAFAPAKDIVISIVVPETGEGFAPASSLETVDAYLTSIGAGAPLEAEAEKKALAALK